MARTHRLANTWACARARSLSLIHTNTHMQVVLVDTTAYAGMRNEPATRVLLYARRVASVLNKHFPGRLIKLIIFPVPSWADFVWRSIKPLLPERTAAKIELRKDAPPEAVPILERLGNTPI